MRIRARDPGYKHMVLRIRSLCALQSGAVDREREVIVFKPFSRARVSPHQAVLRWAGAKVLDVLPAAVIPKALELLTRLMDDETPVWQRALIATALLELLSALNLQVPAVLVLRYAVIAAAFGGNKHEAVVYPEVFKIK